MSQHVYRTPPLLIALASADEIAGIHTKFTHITLGENQPLANCAVDVLPHAVHAGDCAKAILAIIRNIHGHFCSQELKMTQPPGAETSLPFSAPSKFWPHWTVTSQFLQHT